MLPFYARVGSAETERTVNHHNGFREDQRQSLQRARGALGILVSLLLQPHTHGLGGHTHGLGGGACRDRDGCTCRGSLCPAGAGPRKPTLPDWNLHLPVGHRLWKGSSDGHSTLPVSLITNAMLVLAVVVDGC